MNFMKNFLRDDRGNFAITLALSFVPVMMTVAAAVDYSDMRREHSTLQEIADASALYAAKKMEKAGFEQTALESVAEDMKEANFDLDGIAELELDKQASNLTVTLEKEYQPSIMHVFDDRSRTIRVKTVVEYAQTLGAVKCFVALNESGSGILSLNGNAKVVGENCDVHVNSASPDAVDLNGNGTQITANSNCFVGGVASGESRISPPPDDSCQVMPDPFVDIATPEVGECDHHDFSENRRGYREIHPGVYCGGISISSNTDAHFNPGLYVIKDGVFKTNGQAELFGEGVTFFFTGNNIQLDFSGGTDFDFSAMKTGDLKGFIVFFDPNSPTTLTSQFTGNATTRFDGILYFGDNDIDIGGDANINADSPLSIVIARQIKLHGNGTLNFNVDLDATDIDIPESLYDKEIVMHISE